MKFGFVIPGGDVREMVDMGIDIERHGWDAAFGWETVYGIDAWVTLGAIAERTERVLLGTLLTPPSRRRPWKLASEVATLDRLSNGRAVIVVGLGAPETGFAEVGEVTDRQTRAQLMDEALDLMQLFWSGQPFSYEGRHYQVNWREMSRWAIAPIQQPRPPIWVVALAGHDATLRRAARWDGIVPAKRDAAGVYHPMEPEDVRAIRQGLAARSEPGSSHEIIIEGMTPTDDDVALDRVRSLADAGATWWIESMWEHPGGLDAVRARIAAGPPSL